MSDRIMYYHRDGRPVTSDAERDQLFRDMWGERDNPDHMRVAQSFFGEVNVSTVFLGINHAWLGGVLIFESMVFGEPFDHEIADRYATELDAHAGHVRMCHVVIERLLDPPPKPRVRWKLMKMLRARWERRNAGGRDAGEGTGLGAEPGGTGEATE